MEEIDEGKRTKYPELVEESWRHGWRERCEPIKVGCRGFAGQSLCRAYSMVDITGTIQGRAIKLVSNAAKVVLRWLCIRRGEAWVG